MTARVFSFMRGSCLGMKCLIGQAVGMSFSPWCCTRACMALIKAWRSVHRDGRRSGRRWHRPSRPAGAPGPCLMRVRTSVWSRDSRWRTASPRGPSLRAGKPPWRRRPWSCPGPGSVRRGWSRCVPTGFAMPPIPSRVTPVASSNCWKRVETWLDTKRSQKPRWASSGDGGFVFDFMRFPWKLSAV